MKTRTAMITEMVIVYTLILLILGGDGFGFFYFSAKRSKIIKEGRDIQRQEELEIKKKVDESTKCKKEIKRLDKQRKIKDRTDEKKKVKWNIRRNEFKQYLKIIKPYNKKPELIKIINDFAKKFKVVIKDLTTSESPTEGIAGSIRKFSFSMKIEGYYENVKKFLWFLENMEIIVQMEKNGFDFVSLNNEDGKFEVAAKMFTYFFTR
ncbi:type 4a pilus biogenesis protein PilO [bacterium]|nr:type 4a pilus biogenesis protein PilO [bacterium]